MNWLIVVEAFIPITVFLVVSLILECRTSGFEMQNFFDTKTIVNFLKRYHLENGKYPEDKETLLLELENRHLKFSQKTTIRYFTYGENKYKNQAYDIRLIRRATGAIGTREKSVECFSNNGGPVDFTKVRK